MIHVGDAAKTLTFSTDRDISEAETFGFRYEKPDGTTGEVTDGVLLSETGRSFTWAISGNAFFNIAGHWKLQAFAIFDGLYAFGKVAGLKVNQSLTTP